ncbi:MAG TPA: ATP-dependent DNA helicase RecG [Lachnospiraceae bacterium]|nr:ATP-dependent DNA helicase RecG [Lachnospiraceae bacterium]
MTEASPITSIKGIGPKSSEHFAKAGIRTVGDLVRYYPRGYDRFEEPVKAGTLSVFDDGRLVAVEGAIERALSVRYVKSFRITAGKILTDGGYLDVTWFNMPFLRNQVHPGTRYIFRGRIRAKGSRIFLQQPRIYDLYDYTQLQKTMQPVYPLVRGLTENALRKALREAFFGQDHIDLSQDPLPAWMRRKYTLPERKETVRGIHFPEGEEALSRARRRLVFEEFFYFILMLKRLRGERESREDGAVISSCPQTLKVLDALDFDLTGAQKRVWDEISHGLASKKVMARLVQGDVGSGKTIVAFLALIQCAASGMQGALMVPTEVLARQHYESFLKLLGQAGLLIGTVLLTGSMKAAERREAYARILSGEASVVIGTHALIQEKVQYKNLALVITDEQHRFGVHQRETLEEKGIHPHTIVMSATPIPRTLAVILYGDLDISVIDEMPANRLPIKNAVVDQSWRPKAYQFVAKQVQEGHQAYVICPMVEESEEVEAENVMDYTESFRDALRQYLPNVRVEYLHGKMKGSEKQSVMERFASHAIDVLVSTTVVEVGVNVPNATVMMVENAERFGLAQLHQLRGRVGRGKDQSYCIFISSMQSDEIKQRLNILASSNDGFEIARKDLALRGPGELFGLRQSGEIGFAMADPYADAAVLKDAEEAVQTILRDDPSLEMPEYEGIAQELAQAGKREQNHSTI